ncbi:MAG: RecQ family ATP-dependent DNA helicase [Pseudopedobacter saltans]|uniref:ATP-dependent DNA helicase RecQ n=1 Tax=Pseudopedobacter saltans TaxID=151895 RepID=A0A2W5H8T0_9SPHI|nr:MAG: RecQ family ATP-dependent DNA helicase [Pseudopedobacter saltans]
MPTSEEILRKFWGYDQFRPLQSEIIQTILSGEDVLALLPTGAGKSICFQVPAMATPGICIVVTPLIALMNDQVAHLKEKGIPAVAFHSGLNYYEQDVTMRKCIAGDYKFLYLSPERLQSAEFRENLIDMDVNLIAVDEAHCISQWGFDFRPAYLDIAVIREYFPEIPILALTASATDRVQIDIVQLLEFNNYKVYEGSYRRDNISLSVFATESKINKIVDVLGSVQGTAIVYCKTRKLTQDVSGLLRLHKINADYYHAGLSQEERVFKQDNWTRNLIRVMVCTNAFGMGIDKPDVRLVIHHDAPDSLENYYQEAGRAGRDGKKSYAVLLYYPDDIKDLQALPETRYPPFEFIKTCYQDIGNYLQVPVGSGKGEFFDFDFNSFIKHFSLNPLQALYAMKALAQQGFVEFNESVFLPAKIVFRTNRETLNYIEESEPELDRIVKCLLRLYEGIMDHRVSVFISQIAKYCYLTEEEVTVRILKLQRSQVIDYWPYKETPQIHFIENRAPTEYINFDHAFYRNRKEIYQTKIESVVDYIGLSVDCRMNFVCQYFAKQDSFRCGICDNCLKEKKEVLTDKEIVDISARILDRIGPNGILLSDLKKLLDWNDQDIQISFQRLSEEGLLYFDQHGLIRKK